MKKFLRNNGLSLAVFGCFLLFLAGQTITGFHDNNQEQKARGEMALTLGAYLGSGHFWEAVFENWESEFLAVFAIVFLSIWLRERGSPESKPVAAPHRAMKN